MKILLFFSILLCAIEMPALGELTDADLDKIRLIVKEEIKTEIESSNKDIKEYINTKNESIDKRLSLLTTFVVGLIALIVLAVGIPQIIIAWRSRSDQIQSRKLITEIVLEQMTEITSDDKRTIVLLIREQEQKIDALTEEIETLKQQQTVNP